MLDWVVAHRIFLLTALVIIAIVLLIYFVVQEAGIRIKDMSIDNVFKMLTLTVLTITAVILLLNLLYFHKQFKESAAQTHSLQEQISLTKLLNRPICAIKKVEITKPSPHEYHISITVMNFGQYAAENVSFSWECSTVKAERKNGKIRYVPETPIFSFERSPKSISLLPQHEFEDGFYIHTNEVDKVLEKGEKGYMVSARLEYEGIDKKTEKFTCQYLISKPKTFTGAIHVVLLSSNFETL